MNVWIIAAVYQGDFTGIELVTTDEAKAEKRYEELIRQTMGMLTDPWALVLREYTRALDSCLKVDEIYLEEAVVENASVKHCSYCNTGEMQTSDEHYDQGGYSTVVLQCTNCNAQQTIKNIPPEEG